MWYEPDDERLKLAAEVHRSNLGRAEISAEDLEAARRDLYFWYNYEECFKSKLVGASKFKLGHSLRCRYCERAVPEVSFDHESHAIPEFMGNQVLFSLDECDQCNQRFGRTCDDQLSKLTQPFRTMLAITGKRNVPSHKEVGKGFRVDYEPRSRTFGVVSLGEGDFWENDREKNRITARLTSQPFVPIEAYRCLVKMAYALMPEDEAWLYAGVRKWLYEPTPVLSSDMSGWAICGHCFYPPRFPEPWVALLRRKSDDAPSPYMVFLIASEGVMLQIALPTCRLDSHLIGRNIEIPRFDPPTHFPGITSDWKPLDLGLSELKRDLIHKFTFYYESNELLEGPDPDVVKKHDRLRSEQGGRRDGGWH